MRGLRNSPKLQLPYTKKEYPLLYTYTTEVHGQIVEVKRYQKPAGCERFDKGRGIAATARPSTGLTTEYYGKVGGDHTSTNETAR